MLGRQGTRVDILAADRSSGHAIGIDLGVCDKTGLLENGQLYNSLLSAAGGRDGRVFSISIRGDSEIFERIRERRESPALHWTEYCAEPDVDLQDDAALAAAIRLMHLAAQQEVRELAKDNFAQARMIDGAWGKTAELAVREAIHGRPVKNTAALANPEALREFQALAGLHD